MMAPEALLRIVESQAVTFCATWVLAFLGGRRARGGHWLVSLAYLGGVPLERASPPAAAHRQHLRYTYGDGLGTTAVEAPGVTMPAGLALGRRFHTFALATYAGAARYLYAKLALRGQLNNLEWRGPLTFFLAVEGTGQGNAETRTTQAGGSFEVGFVRARLSVGVHAGVQETWSPGQPHTRGPYGGLSLYHSL